MFAQYTRCTMTDETTAEDKERFGISIESSVKRRIEEPLGYRDDRSERVENLIRTGLWVEENMGEDWIINLEEAEQE